MTEEQRPQAPITPEELRASFEGKVDSFLAFRHDFDSNASDEALKHLSSPSVRGDDGWWIADGNIHNNESDEEVLATYSIGLQVRKGEEGGDQRRFAILKFPHIIKRDKLGFRRSLTLSDEIAINTILGFHRNADNPISYLEQIPEIKDLLTVQLSFGLDPNETIIFLPHQTA